MRARHLVTLGLFTICGALTTRAQGGAPLLTDDPGTPGNRNWEINVGFTVDRAPGSHTYETPILDLNYGWGDRIQLKFELPYLLQSTNGAPIQSSLGNSLAGVKWRFYQRKDHDFAISTYPQLEFNNPTDSVRRNIVNRAPNFLLPMEVTYRVGPLALDGEAGYGSIRTLRMVTSPASR